MKIIIFTLLLVCLSSFVLANSDVLTVIIIHEEETASIASSVSGFGGACRYKWECADWQLCQPDNTQTRTCTNKGTCPDTYKIPETQRNCTYIPSLPEEPLPIQKPPETIPEEKPLQPTQPPVPLSFNILIILTLFVITFVMVYDLKIKKKVKKKSKK